VCTKAQPSQKSAIFRGIIFRFFQFFHVFSQKPIVFFRFFRVKIFGCALLERAEEDFTAEIAEGAERKF